MSHKGKHIDQMMAALARKNQQHTHHDQYRDPVTGELKTKPPRGTGNSAGSKPIKKFTGRGR